MQDAHANQHATQKVGEAAGVGTATRYPVKLAQPRYPMRPQQMQTAPRMPMQMQQQGGYGGGFAQPQGGFGGQGVGFGMPQYGQMYSGNLGGGMLSQPGMPGQDGYGSGQGVGQGNAQHPADQSQQALDEHNALMARWQTYAQRNPNNQQAKATIRRMGDRGAQLTAANDHWQGVRQRDQERPQQALRNIPGPFDGESPHDARIDVYDAALVDGSAAAGHARLVPGWPGRCAASEPVPAGGRCGRPRTEP
jgi:hypothetical protein